MYPPVAGSRREPSSWEVVRAAAVLAVASGALPESVACHADSAAPTSAYRSRPSNNCKSRFSERLPSNSFISGALKVGVAGATAACAALYSWAFRRRMSKSVIASSCAHSGSVDRVMLRTLLKCSAAASNPPR